MPIPHCSQNIYIVDNSCILVTYKVRQIRGMGALEDIVRTDQQAFSQQTYVIQVVSKLFAYDCGVKYDWFHGCEF